MYAHFLLRTQWRLLKLNSGGSQTFDSINDAFLRFLRGSPTASRNTLSDLFAILLYSDSVGDWELQQAALLKFRPIVRSAAHKTGYMRFYQEISLSM
jgi:hypothetical protein